MTLTKDATKYQEQKAVWDQLMKLDVAGIRIWGTALLQAGKAGGLPLHTELMER